MKLMGPICFVRGMSRAYTKEFQRKHCGGCGIFLYFLKFVVKSCVGKNDLELSAKTAILKMGQKAQGI